MGLFFPQIFRQSMFIKIQLKCLSFHGVSPGDQTQIISLGGKLLHPLSCLVSLERTAGLYYFLFCESSRMKTDSSLCFLVPVLHTQGPLTSRCKSRFQMHIKSRFQMQAQSDFHINSATCPLGPPFPHLPVPLRNKCTSITACSDSTNR